MRLGVKARGRNARPASRRRVAPAWASPRAAAWASAGHGAYASARHSARAFACVLALALAPIVPTLADTPAAPAARAPAASPLQPTDAEVTAAIAKLNADPNLGLLKKSRTLRWKSSNKPPPVDDSSWLAWVGQLFAWFAGAARALLWVAGILLAGILALYIKRFLELRGGRSIPLRITMPTHVRDLDIRPESLPDDIGGAALELWERGEHRAALALLYRGLLSRLAHVHGAPIRDSSTEGDCLELASKALPPAGATYAARLIRVWQRAVYGNLEPPAGEFQSLSAAFATSVEQAA